MNLQPTYCFESVDHYNLFCTLFPQKAQCAITLPSLLNFFAAIPLQSKEERLALFGAWLTLEEQPKASLFLSTLEHLRESLILTHEHADHCFDSLSLTPKNNRLRELLHLYLDSPLRVDLTEQMWTVIGELKNKKRNSPFPHLCLVKAPRSTTLYGELHTAFSYADQISDLELIEFWDCFKNKPSPTPASTSPLFLADATLCLIYLGNAVREKLASQSEPLFIAFGGKPQSLRFLLYYFAHLKIPLRTLFAEIPTGNLESNDARVTLFPFQALPLTDLAFCFSYVDESVLEPRAELCLSESELNLLLRLGFTIPRIASDQAYLHQMLSAATLDERAQALYSPLPLSTFPERALQSLPNIPENISHSRLFPLLPKKAPLSATQLENYATCPTQYFVQYRLGLRKIQTLEDKYSLLLGQATHLTLERYLKEGLKDLNSLFAECLTAICPQLSPSDPLFLMLRLAFRPLGNNFLVLENELKSAFGVTGTNAFELAFSFQLNEFCFRGKIDRLTTRADGSLLILDYKTGKLSFSPNHILAGSHFQALLYLLAAPSLSPDPCSGILFYDLKEGELRRGLIREEHISKELKKSLTRGHVFDEEKMEALLKPGTENLLKIAGQIQQGVFDPTPSTIACEYCSAAAFCRVKTNYV